MQVGEIIGAKLPANFRVPRERPCPGARRVYQNAIEPAFERQRLRAIDYDGLNISNARGFESLRHRSYTMLVQIRSDYVSLRPGRAGQENCFSTRRGTKIENGVSVLDGQKMRHGLGRFILNCNPASPYGVARSRISSMERQRVAQQNSRFDHASCLLE